MPPTAPSAPNSGDVTYYAVTRSYGHPAYVDAHGMRGGLKRLVLGNYVKLEQAQQACERHYRGGCDLSVNAGAKLHRPAGVKMHHGKTPRRGTGGRIIDSHWRHGGGFARSRRAVKPRSRGAARRRRGA